MKCALYIFIFLSLSIRMVIPFQREIICIFLAKWCSKREKDFFSLPWFYLPVVVIVVLFSFFSKGKEFIVFAFDCVFMLDVMQFIKLFRFEGENNRLSKGIEISFFFFSFILPFIRYVCAPQLSGFCGNGRNFTEKNIYTHTELN